MAALITIASGDPLAEAATFDEVLTAVQTAGVTHGIDDELLRRAASRAREGETIDELIIARGRHPSGRGEGRLEMLVATEENPAGTASPAVDENESTHQGRIAVVSSGTTIARFRPIDDGSQNGWDVTGAAIQAKAIQPESSDVETGENIRAEPQPDGGFLLVAEVDGELFLKKKRFEVRRRTVIGDDVDESSGNVRVTGSVVVRGTVRSGHFVVSGGDLYIGRNVEAALLSAEGDIVINNGVLGHGKAVLRTRKSVGLTFAEQSTILAVGNIQARNSLVDCTIKTNGKIRMIGKQSSVVGGFIKTRIGLETIDLGSDTGAPTRVDFGQNVLVADQIEREEQEIEKLKVEITRINTILEKSEEGGEKVNLDELHARKLRAMKLLEKRCLRLFTLREQFEEHFDSKVIVRGSVYPGVVIESHGRSLAIAAETKNVMFSFNPQTGQIVENRLNRVRA